MEFTGGLFGQWKIAARGACRKMVDLFAMAQRDTRPLAGIRQSRRVE
jgi:hypothetical protein